MRGFVIAWPEGEKEQRYWLDWRWWWWVVVGVGVGRISIESTLEHGDGNWAAQRVDVSEKSAIEFVRGLGSEPVQDQRVEFKSSPLSIVDASQENWWVVMLLELRSYDTRLHCNDDKEIHLPDCDGDGDDDTTSRASNQTPQRWTSKSI